MNVFYKISGLCGCVCSEKRKRLLVHANAKVANESSFPNRCSKWQIFPYTIQHCFNSQAHRIHFSTESSPISSTSHCLTLYAYCYALLILVGYRHPSAMPITCHLFHTTFHSHMIVYVSAHNCMPVCL